MSAQATVGQMVCAVGAPRQRDEPVRGLGVPRSDPGGRREVLELCDEGDAFGLCRYVAACERPPRFETREGEPLVSCTLVLHVADSSVARRVLNEVYEPEDDGWMEMHQLSDDERILRAQLTLDDDTLTVSTQSSRASRGCWHGCAASIPDLEIVADERVPLRPGELPQFRVPLPGAPGAADPDDPAVRDEITGLMEQRWLRE